MWSVPCRCRHNGKLERVSAAEPEPETAEPEPEIEPPEPDIEPPEPDDPDIKLREQG